MTEEDRACRPWPVIAAETERTALAIGVTCPSVGVSPGSQRPGGRDTGHFWNGAILRPAQARQILGIGPTAIDCPTAAYCVAVGLRVGARLAFSAAAELWNGWTSRSLATASP